jgi:hypothetical protein
VANGRVRGRATGDAVLRCLPQAKQPEQPATLSKKPLPKSNALESATRDPENRWDIQRFESTA